MLQTIATHQKQNPHENHQKLADQMFALFSLLAAGRDRTSSWHGRSLPLVCLSLRGSPAGKMPGLSETCTVGVLVVENPSHSIYKFKIVLAVILPEVHHPSGTRAWRNPTIEAS